MKVPYLDLRVSDAGLKTSLLTRFEKILDHGRIIEGPEQQEFEERFANEIGVKYAVGVSSGSSALFLALLGSGVGPGDEVITTPLLPPSKRATEKLRSLPTSEKGLNLTTPNF